jgi:hypothetical protein
VELARRLVFARAPLLSVAPFAKIQLPSVFLVLQTLTAKIAKTTARAKMVALASTAELETVLVLVQLDISEITAKFSVLALQSAFTFVPITVSALSLLPPTLLRNVFVTKIIRCRIVRNTVTRILSRTARVLVTVFVMMAQLERVLALAVSVVTSLLPLTAQIFVNALNSLLLFLVVTEERATMMERANVLFDLVVPTAIDVFLVGVEHFVILPA